MSKIQFTPRVWAAVGVVAAVSAGGSAHAALITVNPIITPNGTTSSSANPFVSVSNLTTGSASGSPSILKVQQFDSSLGDLQAVELRFNASELSSEMSGIANLAACNYRAGASEGGNCAYSYSVAFGVNGDVTTPDGTMAQTANGSGSGSLNVSDQGPAGDSSPFFADILGDVFLSMPINLGTSPFTPYTGGSTWDLSFEVDITNVNFSSTCVGTDDSSCDPADQGGKLDGVIFWPVNAVQVAYTYLEPEVEPVPEPGSLLLAVIGLGAAAYARRPRRKNSGTPLQ